MIEEKYRVVHSFATDLSFYRKNGSDLVEDQGVTLTTQKLTRLNEHLIVKMHESVLSIVSCRILWRNFTDALITWNFNKFVTLTICLVGNADCNIEQDVLRLRGIM